MVKVKSANSKKSVPEVELNREEKSVLLVLYACRVGQIENGAMTEIEIWRAIQKLGLYEMDEEEFNKLAKSLVKDKERCRKLLLDRGIFGN